MKKLSIILLLLLFVGVIPVYAITWGELDTAHTNVGAMVADYPDYGPYQVCSGTLIHPRLFLTAGHCTSGWEGTGVTRFWVNFDEDALNLKTLLDVEAVITHPDYNWGPTSNPHDVGILVLKKPVRKIKPANLPEEGFLDELLAAGILSEGSDRAKFTLVGYGGTLEWPPPYIEYDDQRRFAISEFRALLKSWLRMSQNAATGWGDASCVASAFNYRVDIPDTLDFINDQIESVED
jgi:hypothetical protein